MIDFILLGILLGVTWCVASEGAWGAVLTFFVVVFSGLLAMNFFEPLAGWLAVQVPSWRDMFDVLTLVGLFILFVCLMRFGTEYIAPTMIQLHTLAYEGLRWGFGFLTAYVTMAILLTALHTAPFPREFMGFKAERKNLLSVAAPDRQWLGFVQHVSEHIFARRQLVQDSQGQIRTVKRMFDGLQNPDPNRQDEPLSTFLIRYASRREMLAGGAGSLAAPAPASQSGGPRGGPVF